MTEQPQEQLYTMQDAVMLGRRALCNTNDEGHDIGPLARLRNFNGTFIRYGCRNCDVRVILEYPELPSRQGGAAPWQEGEQR